jgi:hypothetical protein
MFGYLPHPRAREGVGRQAVAARAASQRKRATASAAGGETSAQ